MILLVLARPLSAQPTITFKDPIPPSNMTRVLAQRCPGELCLENCVFTLSNLTCTVTFTRDPNLSAGSCDIALLDSNGKSLASISQSLSNVTTEIKPVWTGTKEVTCDTKEVLKLRVVTSAINAQLNSYSRTNTLEFALHCVGCEKTTRTEGNGATKTEHSTADQPVRLGCVIVNLDQDTQIVEVTVNSSRGWLILPVASPLVLANGEAREVFLDVVVPGGTVDGTEDTITVASAFPGQPGSVSVATMAIQVETPLRLRISGFDPVGNVALQVSGPWNAEFLVEWSDNLRTWTELAIATPTPGAEFVVVSDPPPRPGNARFYRARIQTPPSP
jgi:hypothetical protein